VSLCSWRIWFINSLYCLSL